MQWKDSQLPDGNVERTIIFSSTSELTHFRRIIAGDDELPATHRQKLKYIPHPTDPKGLPTLVMAMVPLELGDIAKSTNNFDKLGIVPLRSLIRRYEIKLPPPVKGAAVKQDERIALIGALLDHLTKPGATKASKKKDASPILPTNELMKLKDATLEEMAARNGCITEFVKARKRGKVHGVAVLARAMQERAKDDRPAKAPDDDDDEIDATGDGDEVLLPPPGGVPVAT